MLVDKKTLQIGEGVVIDAIPGAEYVQLRILGRDERTVRIRMVDLYAAVFAMADEKTQDALMPVRQSQVMTFEKIHNVQLKKDLKKGQTLRVRCHVDVPLIIEEKLKGLTANKASASTIALS